MEQNKNHPPLLLEAFSQWIVDAFRKYRVPFLASLLWGILAYMFAFTNKLINHDEVGQLFGKGATVSSGRWGLGALDMLFPNISMPWIYGIMTLILISVSICLILRIFDIKHTVIQVLLSGSIMVFPSLIGLFGYMFTSSSYALSFLLAAAAVLLITSPGKQSVLPAIVCLVLSLSIYQSYISIAASLLVLVLIQRLLDGDEAANVLKKGIGYVLFLIIGLGLYYLATQLILKLKGIAFNDYASGNIAFSPAHLLDGLRLAYVNFLRFFTWRHHRLIPTSLSAYLHVALIAVTGCLLMLWAGKQTKPRMARFLLLLLLIALLPLAINCMYLITAEDSIHTLVLYSFVAIYILAAVLADRWLREQANSRLPELLRRIALDGAAIALAGIIIINTYTANAAYLTLHLRYENAYAFYTSLLSDIRQTPEFQEDTPLAVIGGWDSPAYYEAHMDFTYYLVGVKGFLPSDYSARYFMEYYIGFPAVFASAEDISAIQQTEDFRNMPVYPYYGSIGVINDTIVVKLSE